MYGWVVLPCCVAKLNSLVASQQWATASSLPSVLPECGGLQVVSVGLQHAGVVTAEVLAVSHVADGQLVVVAKLEEEVDGCVAAAHH